VKTDPDVPALEQTALHLSLSRPSLFLGGDRELVLLSMLVAGTLVFYVLDVLAALLGVVGWLATLMVLRRAARYDPRLREVYLRHRRYQAHYPPFSSPVGEV
jgi:type IV secretion system protein VirB3